MIDQSLDNQTPDSVGKLLRNAREAQGMALDAISNILRINKSRLGSFESDDESLTCDVYTLGFLRSYAQHLSLNADELIQKFKDQIGSSPSSPAIFPTPLSKRGTPSYLIIVLSLFVLTGSVIGYEWIRTRHSVSIQQEAFVALAPSQEPPQPVVQEEAVIAPSPPVVNLSDSTLLKVTEDSWIEVRDEKGDIVVSRLFHPQETYEFKDSQGFVLKTGNARGIHLMSGEKSISFPGQQGEIKTGISLDPEKWTKH